jgi:PHD/YefM family antitoxin component YafN of YafNO toxin-antitoxin module
MIQHSDTHPLTDFLQNHKEHVERLQKEQRPEMLTIDGQPALVVQDAESYQRLLDQVERAEALEGIRRGIVEMEAGKGRPAEEFFTEMRAKRGIPEEG